MVNKIRDFLTAIKLKEGQEADVHVAWEDQDRINRFSKLNARMEKYGQKLTTAKVRFGSKRGVNPFSIDGIGIFG